MHLKFHMQKDKGLGTTCCNKKRENSIEADGIRDTPLNPISSLPTTNRLSAMGREASKTNVSPKVTFGSML